VLKEQFPGKVDCLLNALRYGVVWVTQCCHHCSPVARWWWSM